MKRMLLATAIAGLMLAGSPAFAAPSPDAARHGWQERGHDHDRGKHKHKDKHWKRNGHDNGRHLGWYKQQWRRGDRMPVVYLQPRYYVDDYRAYRLSAPPRGYRWVRPYENSQEFLLVQVATGLISQILDY
jgi:Ni/Co efflux regulator RcnB